MDGFLAQLRRLQNDYNVAKGGAGTHVTPDTSAKVWNVLRPWNDAQVGCEGGCRGGHRVKVWAPSGTLPT